MADCFVKIREMFPELPVEVIQNFVKEAESIKGISKNLNEFKLKSQQSLREYKGQLLSNYKRAALNAQKRAQFTELVNSHDGNALEALKTAIAGNQGGKAGSRTGVAQHANALRNRFYSMLEAGLEKEQVEIAKNGTADRQIAEVMEKLSQKGDVSGYDANIVKIATTFRKINADLLHQLRRVGLEVNEIKDYITKQSHNMDLVRNSGVTEWKNFVKDKLSPDTFRHLKASTPDEMRTSIDNFLEGVWKDISYGKYIETDKAINADDNIISFTLNRSTEQAKAGVSRTLHFKDAVTWYEYNMRFGERTILQSIVKQMENTARRAGMVSVFGPNPDVMFEGLWKRAEASLKQKEDFEGLKKLNEGRKGVKQLYDHVAGLRNQSVGMGTMSKVGASIRAIQDLNKLTFVTLSTLPDAAAGAATVRSMSGDNYYTALSKNIRDFFSQIKNPELSKKLAKRIYIASNVHAGQYFDRFGAGDMVPGALKNTYTTKDAWDLYQKGETKEAAKAAVDVAHGGISTAQRWFFKWNGLTKQTDVGRTTIAHQTSLALGDASPLKFSELNKFQKGSLEAFGINNVEWELLRNKGVEIDAFGEKGITPEAVEEIPLEFFKVFQGKGRRSLEFYRTDLAMKVASLLVDHADLGMRIPGARVQSRMNMGADDNSAYGQFLKFFWQYKSFAMTSLDLLERVRKGGGSDLSGTANFIIASTGLGYLSVILSDAIKGTMNNEMPQIKIPKTMGEAAELARRAFVKGGSFGLYGDLLMNEWGDNRTLARGLLGPTLGQAEDLVDILGETRESVIRESFYSKRGKLPIAKLGLRTLRNNIPLKPAMDLLILNGVQKELDPEWEVRQLRRQVQEGKKPIF